MCTPIYSKIATCTNLAKYFSAVKTEMRHENFPSFNYNCRSCNLRIVATCMHMCVQVCKHFFYDQPTIRMAGINFETNLTCSRVESHARVVQCFRDTRKGLGKSDGRREMRRGKCKD